jgi:hypothetical protein
MINIDLKHFIPQLEKLSEEKGLGIGAGVGAYLAGATPRMVSTAYFTPRVHEMVNDISSKDPLGGNANKKFSNNQVSNLQRSMGTKVPVYRNTIIAASGGGGAAMPDSSVHFYSKKKTLSPRELATLSHEFGHTKNFKTLGRAKLPYLVSRRIGQGVAPLASLYTAFAKNDKDARNAAIAGTVLPGAMLAEEATATARGMKGLTKHYGGGASGFRKALFKGRGGGARLIASNLLSYGAAAGAPLLTYAARQKFRKKPEVVKND